MKKALFFILSILLAVLCAVTPVTLAQTSLGEKNTALQTLVEEGNIDSAEAYQLLYDGEELIKAGEGEEEEKAIFYAYKDLYYKTKAIKQVTEACNDSNQTVKIKGDTFVYFAEQYNQVIAYREAFLQAVEESSEYAALADAFFAAVRELPTMATLVFEQSGYISGNLNRVDDHLFQTVNESLLSRGFSPFSENERYVAEEEEYENWLLTLLRSTYNETEVQILMDSHAKLIADLNAVSVDKPKEVYDALADEWISALDAMPQRTVTVQQGLLEITRAAERDVLIAYRQSEEYRNQGAKYREEVDAIIDRALELMEKATSPQEIRAISEGAQNEIADIRIKDNRWIWMLLLAIALFLTFGILAFVYFKRRARKKGVEKYNRLLEEERERMEKEILRAMQNEGREGLEENAPVEETFTGEAPQTSEEEVSEERETSAPDSRKENEERE